MFPNKIKEGAVFVADAHINEEREDFFNFLRSIEKEDIKTPQLFLMGDIFDLLVGNVKYTYKINQKYIDLINEISKKIEVFYFEGNHDFNLKKVFPNAKVFSFSEQPVLFKMGDSDILLLHGDKATPFAYILYTTIIRSKTTLSVISTIDNLSNGFISKKIINSQYKKNICKKIKNFKEIITQRVSKFSVLRSPFSIIIEGHFHQDVTFDLKEDIKYINIPSFACNKSFIIVQSHLEFKKTEFK